MNTHAFTPDLFAEPPRAVNAQPSFAHSKRDCEQGWRHGWRRHTGGGWSFEIYDSSVFAWLRQQLADGPMDYMDIVQARRDARLDRPFDVADIIRAHLRYLVLAGEATERKRYFGHSDASHPDYRGWHPVIDLAGSEAA